MGKFRKNPDSAKKHEEKRYEFIKEQIRPQRKRYLVQFANRIFEFIIFAIVFGGVAGIVFWNVNKELGVASLSAKNIPLIDDIPSMVPEYQASQPENTGTAYNAHLEDINKEDMAVIEEQNRASKKLSAIGNQFAASLVHVIDKNSKDAWYQTDSSPDTAISGMFFKRTNLYYYIIAASGSNANEEFAVEFEDGETVDAEYISSDSNIGLSVLCVAKKDISSSRREKIVIPDFGSAISVPAGSNVIIAGAPNGVMYSVMTGNIIKSGISMPITDNEITLFATDIFYTEHANGVVLNTRGRVIGFITSSYKSATGRSNIGFIGISSIRDIIDWMAEGRVFPYLGVEGYNVDTDTAKAHNIEEGVYLSAIYPGSPAYSGGMRVADVIKQIDGSEVSSLKVLHNILKYYDAGDTINVTVSRKSGKKNNIKNCTVVLG